MDIKQMTKISNLIRNITGSVVDYCQKENFDQDEFKAKLEDLKLEYNECREDLIRSKSYFLWEEAGRPEGRSEEFWTQAEELLDV